jgi:hypothetical protein
MSAEHYAGKLVKMGVQYAEPVRYRLSLGGSSIDMNAGIGSHLSISYSGEIRCVRCDRRTRKSYGDGYCYPCFRDAPENAQCIIRPELCRAHLGEGRDPAWEEEHHNRPHALYLALTNTVKVGVTRWTQLQDRWIDQGAARGIVAARTPYRALAGRMEVAVKELFTDRTNWRRMLRDERGAATDLREARERLLAALPDDLQQYRMHRAAPLPIRYPLESPPGTIRSLNLDKCPAFSERLIGIRGQYLVFADGTVFNVRRYSGYIVDIKLGG